MHVLQGTFRAHRHGDEGTLDRVEAPAGRPPAPAGLAGEARAEWGRMVDRLEQLGILSRVDDAVLVAYVELHADAARLQTAADALPSPLFEKVTVDGSGQEHREPKVHPVFGQLRALRMAQRQYLVELGLTPASRARVTRPAFARPPIQTADKKKAKYFRALA